MEDSRTAQRIAQLEMRLHKADDEIQRLSKAIERISAAMTAVTLQRK
tara:strand:- start:1180 stop:1320 length:141 start_codon:yes stop_codon:yes gene_type:complete